MNEKRTEEEKICRAPLLVVFGGTEYEVQPLVIRDSREWRKKLVGTLSKLPAYAQATTDDPKEFAVAIEALLVSMPDDVVDLFFGYAKDLNREEIEAIATDEEMGLAFSGVVKVAFPLAKALVGAMEVLGQV